jgi:ferredoxin/flavodoxin---NADP+ reductase
METPLPTQLRPRLGPTTAGSIGPARSFGSIPTAAVRTDRRREFTANATLADRVDLTPLISRLVVVPDSAVLAFEPGQYFSLGLQIEGKLVLRPYSTASPRGQTGSLEFLVRRVPGGAFTPSLWEVGAGDRIWIGPPKGLFTLKRDDPRTHLFVSSGTGIAPFMSMLTDVVEAAPPLADARHGGSPIRAVVAHGVSYAPEFAYRRRLEELAALNPRFRYVPTVSRPDDPSNADWMGRSGRVEAILARTCGELMLDPANTVAYLCGNPDMVERSREVLSSLGFPEAAIVHENYWTVASLP